MIRPEKAVTAQERVKRQPRLGWAVVPPLPGERRKQSSLLVLTKPWRSKWTRVACMGAARACVAGECRHVETMCRAYKYMRPEARVPR